MMMNQGGGMNSMSDVLSGGNMPTGQLSPQFVNPTSMSPVAMGNMMGSPLANQGANMNNAAMVHGQMFPATGRSEGVGGMNAGGLVRFAEGGMPPPATPPEAGAGGGGGALNEMAAQAGSEDGEGGNPELQAMVEQIFQEGMDDPEGIANKLLELVKAEISKVVSPEQMEYLQTPEGEHELQQIVQEIMSSAGTGAEGAQGGLGGLEGMAGAGGGGPPGGGGGLAAMGAGGGAPPA